MTALLLANKRCSQCLTTRNRIVSGERAAKIIRECRTRHNHFFCHKAMDGKVHCRGVHDIVGGSRAYDFAKRFDIPIQEVNINGYD